MPLLDRLKARGLVSTLSAAATEALVDISPGLRQPPAVYAGFDPTAPSLHLGNLLVLTTLRHFQLAGWKPIVLVGGATGLIGDPSGKASDRALLDEATVATNLAGIQESVQHVLDGDGPTGVTVLNNADFYTNMSAIELVRDVGRHFRMHTMLGRDSVKARIAPAGTGMSFTEFSYQLFQAYDFAHLAERHNCVAQIGGSDQWGNIASGLHLTHALLGREVHGLTVPLLTTATGEKFGKSAGNAIWLNPSMVSDHALYQHLLNTSDDDVEKQLLMLTLVPVEEVADVMKAHTVAPQHRAAQKLLAKNVVESVRGPASALAASASADAVFSGAEGPQASQLQSAADSGALPSWTVPKADVSGGSTCVADAVLGCGLAASKAACRRLAASGGLYVNGVREENPRRVLELGDFVDGVCGLRAGKKQHGVVLLDG